MSQHDRILKWKPVGRYDRRCGGFIDSHVDTVDACAGTLAVLLAMVPAAAQTAEVRQAAVAARRRPRQSRNIAARLLNIRRRKPLRRRGRGALGASLRKNGVSASPSARAKKPLTLDDYVLAQPPVYAGPPKPVDPSQTPEEKPPSTRPYVPVVADFLAAAQRNSNSFRASRKAKVNSSAPTGKSPSRPA